MQLLSALQLEILNVLFLLAIVVLLCLRGLYGSAVAVLSGVVSKVACRLLVLRRPAGFLTNNEKHDACMLVGVHRNCTTWYLYTGDRGVVDYLLNKPMIEPLKPSVWLSGWFKIAHIVRTHWMQMPILISRPFHQATFLSLLPAGHSPCANAINLQAPDLSDDVRRRAERLGWRGHDDPHALRLGLVLAVWGQADGKALARHLGDRDRYEELSIWWQDPDDRCHSVLQRGQRHDVDGPHSRTLSAASSFPFATRRPRSEF